MIVRKLRVNDGRSERELLVVGTITVGRDPSCQLNDLDPLLSRKHAEFVLTTEGVTIRDLNSRNGILVNGEKVPQRKLKPGDQIQLGHLHLLYIEEQVVKTAEDHSRSFAQTEIDLAKPTMAPPARPAKKAPEPGPAAAPTASIDDTAAMTVAPAARAAAPAPVSSQLAKTVVDKRANDDGDEDADATMAPIGRVAAAVPSVAPPRPAVPVRPADDPDATRAPGMHKTAAAVEDLDATRVPGMHKAAAAVEDLDATHGPGSAPLSLDETRAPIGRPSAPVAAVKPAGPAEARVVANASQVVTEASPSCYPLLGARPETIVGGQLSDLLSRALTFVASGDGPQCLTLSIERTSSGKTITAIFKPGHATENRT